ncbi:hypothetical protein RhiLY_04839 [Ceratobasidium sp. AG-Ba]|nr:hypothetical protein RhiLY_04839 [Ceratobasidium sp. AG-Ba]
MKRKEPPGEHSQDNPAGHHALVAPLGPRSSPDRGLVRYGRKLEPRRRSAVDNIGYEPENIPTPRSSLYLAAQSSPVRQYTARVQPSSVKRIGSGSRLFAPINTSPFNLHAALNHLDERSPHPQRRGRPLNLDRHPSPSRRNKLLSPAPSVIDLLSSSDSEPDPTPTRTSSPSLGSYPSPEIQIVDPPTSSDVEELVASHPSTRKTRRRIVSSPVDEAPWRPVPSELRRRPLAPEFGDSSSFGTPSRSSSTPRVGGSAVGTRAKLAGRSSDDLFFRPGVLETRLDTEDRQSVGGTEDAVPAEPLPHSSPPSTPAPPLSEPTPTPAPELDLSAPGSWLRKVQRASSDANGMNGIEFDLLAGEFTCPLCDDTCVCDKCRKRREQEAEERERTGKSERRERRSATRGKEQAEVEVEEQVGEPEGGEEEAQAQAQTHEPEQEREEESEQQQEDPPEPSQRSSTLSEPQPLEEPNESTLPGSSTNNPNANPNAKRAGYAELMRQRGPTKWHGRRTPPPLRRASNYPAVSTNDVYIPRGPVEDAEATGSRPISPLRLSGPSRRRVYQWTRMRSFCKTYS